MSRTKSAKEQRTSVPVEKRPLQVSGLSRLARELIRPRRRLMTLGLFLIFINRLAGLVHPGAAKFLLDEVVQKHDAHALRLLVLTVGGAVVVQAATAFLLTQLLGKTAQRLVTDLRIKLQQHIGRLPVSFYDANKTGALVSRIMSDVEGVRNLVGTGLVDFLGALLTALGAFGLLMKINATLTLVIFGLLTLFTLSMSKALRAMRSVFRERAALTAEVSGRLAESVSGIRIVKGFHAEAREASTFAAGARRLLKSANQTLTTTAWIALSTTLWGGLVSLIVMVAGGHMIAQGKMTVGDFFAYSLYLGFMIGPVLQAGNLGNQVMVALAGLDRVQEVLTERPEDADPQRIEFLSEIKGHVRFKNVTFNYTPGKPVLQGIDLEAIPGAVTALVGPSGSGKSTLIGLVAAFVRATGGKVYVDDVDLSTVRLDSYRPKLGIVLQESFLFDGTIRENILFGRPDASDSEVIRAAQIARVDEFILQLDKGYDTMIGERGVKLSGGQRQRLAIARAILANPRILILDEATSSLDTESEALIQQSLVALMRGRTTFIIAHRLSTIRQADQILVLEEGVITERGTHEQLMARRGRYFDLHMRQADLQANRFINPGESEPPADAKRIPGLRRNSDTLPTADRRDIVNKLPPKIF